MHSIILGIVMTNKSAGVEEHIPVRVRIDEKLSIQKITGM
jgi:hypothetical protein